MPRAPTSQRPRPSRLRPRDPRLGDLRSVKTCKQRVHRGGSQDVEVRRGSEWRGESPGGGGRGADKPKDIIVATEGRTNQRTSLSLPVSPKMEILFHVGINKVPCPNRSCGQGKITLGREGHLFPPCPLFQCWRKSFSPAFLDIDGTFLIPLETPPKHCHNIEKRGCGGQGLKRETLRVQLSLAHTLNEMVLYLSRRGRMKTRMVPGWQDVPKRTEPGWQQ